MLTRALKKKSKGFTLIELLVVVAIIGILAALLFPAIQGALLKAKGMKIGSNGRQIHLGIFDENLSLDQLDLPLIWPVTAPDADDYTPEFVTACGNSTDYFKWCVTNEVIKGIDTSFFSSPGVTPESDFEKFDKDNNAWCITLDLDDGSGAATPFIFTKNFQFTGATIDTMDESDPLNDAKGMPFNGKVGIVITKGGRVQVLDVKFLKDLNDSKKLGKELFNPSGANNSFIGPTAVGTTE